MNALTIVIVTAAALFGCPPLHAEDLKVDTEKLPAPASGKMDFVKDIRPIFERSCIQCHQFDRARQSGIRIGPAGGLPLDFGRDAALGHKGFIVPGKSEKSRLIHVVAWLVPESPMPPAEKERLSAVDIGKLRAWIDQGADWPSYTPKLPDGYLLVNLFVKEEFPSEGGDKIWSDFAARYEKLSRLKVSLVVSGKKAKMFLGGGYWDEPVFVWRPFIPSKIAKIRLFIPEIVAAKVQVGTWNPFEKDGWKEIWSHEGSGSSVLSPEIEVGLNGFRTLVVRVVTDKILTVGVTNLVLIAPTDAAKK